MNTWHMSPTPNASPSTQAKAPNPNKSMNCKTTKLTKAFAQMPMPCRMRRNSVSVWPGCFGASRVTLGCGSDFRMARSVAQ